MRAERLIPGRSCQEQGDRWLAINISLIKLTMHGCMEGSRQNIITQNQYWY